jgi:hypothetical protein
MLLFVRPKGPICYNIHALLNPLQAEYSAQCTLQKAWDLNKLPVTWHILG